jgi:hypothetical protein
MESSMSVRLHNQIIAIFTVIKLPILFTAHDLVYAVLAACQISIEDEKFSTKKNLNTISSFQQI